MSVHTPGSQGSVQGPQVDSAELSNAASLRGGTRSQDVEKAKKSKAFGQTHSQPEPRQADSGNQVNSSGVGAAAKKIQRKRSFQNADPNGATTAVDRQSQRAKVDVDTSDDVALSGGGRSQSRRKTSGAINQKSTKAKQRSQSRSQTEKTDPELEKAIEESKEKQEQNLSDFNMHFGGARASGAKLDRERQQLKELFGEDLVDAITGRVNGGVAIEEGKTRLELSLTASGKTSQAEVAYAKVMLIEMQLAEAVRGDTSEEHTLSKADMNKLHQARKGLLNRFGAEIERLRNARALGRAIEPIFKLSAKASAKAFSVGELGGQNGTLNLSRTLVENAVKKNPGVDLSSYLLGHSRKIDLLVGREKGQLEFGASEARMANLLALSVEIRKHASIVEQMNEINTLTKKTVEAPILLGVPKADSVGSQGHAAAA